MSASAAPTDLAQVPSATRPKVFHAWRKIEEDEYTLLEQRFAAWINGFGEMETAFKQHVYDNKDLTDSDLRQHRQLLYHALWVGEKIAVDLLVLDQPNKQESIQKYVLLIDAKLTELRETLHSWHGAIEHQGDMPQSLKDSFKELNRGELFPLDDVLEEQAK